MAKRSSRPSPGILTTFQMRPETYEVVKALKRASGVSMKEFVSRAVENEIARMTGSTVAG